MNVRLAARLLVLLTAWALSLDAAAQGRRSFRVMTWNIAAGGGDLARIAAVIGEAGPDIAALQEVDVHWHERSLLVDQASRLGTLTGMHVRFAPIYRLPAVGGAPPREFGLAILSRHRVIEFQNHVLPRLSTQSAATEPDEMPGFPEVVVEIGGTRLRVFNTHLDYRTDPGVRMLQVAATLRRLDSVSGPTILMGDLNAPPGAAELQPLFKRLGDAWPATGNAGFTYPANAPVRRIDYILTSKDLRALSVEVLAVEASDHRPVVADVTAP